MTSFSPDYFLIGFSVVALFVGFVAFVFIWRHFWYVPDADEALIITGTKGKDQRGFEIVTGHGKFVKPLIQNVDRLGLQLREALFDIPCPTQQGVDSGVTGVCIYKIGDDLESISNAARRFIGQEDRMDVNILHLIEGHVRGIIGSMTMEQLIRDKDSLSIAVANSISTEVSKLGLIIDSLQIKAVKDPSQYILKMSQPHVAAVEQQARVARANEDQTATLAEQQAIVAIAKSKRDTQLTQSGLQAEIDTQNEKTMQAGPLARAEAQKAVLIKQTEIQTLNSQLKAQELLVTIKRPAEAAAEALRIKAQADKDAAVFAAQASAAAVLETGKAHAESTRLQLIAEADGMKAKGEALALNKEAVLAQSIIPLLPEIVGRAAQAVASIDSMTVLNGAEGVNDAVMSIIATAMKSIGVVRGGLA